MSNNLDEILSLTKEISFQDSEDIDITVTEYGEKLSETGRRGSVLHISGCI